MPMRTLLRLWWLCAVGACSSGPTVVPADDPTGQSTDDGDDGDDNGDAPSMPDAPDGGPPLPAPEIYDAPTDVAQGGRLYVIVDTLPRDLSLDIDGVALGQPVETLRTDLPGAIYRIPDAVAFGPATLSVRQKFDSDAVATWDINVVPRRFVDIAARVGLDVRHDATGSPNECAESHTGLAVGDADGDGNVDLVLGNVGSGAVLMRNRGDTDDDGLPEFIDDTAALGIGDIDEVASATFVDLEGDGDQDLFIGRRGTNRVLQNRLVEDGEPGFIDITAALGLDQYSQRTMGVAFGDYDGDDDLDLYIVNHAFCFPDLDSDIRAGDHLYENVDGVFVERTEQITGVATDSVGFSASWVDMDRDGDVDLVIINDAIGGSIGKPNAVWRNDGPAPEGGWRFTDISSPSGVGIPGVNGMGLAMGDVDHDGAVDLAFSNIGPNKLLLGNGNLSFSDVSADAGMERARLPWDRESTTWSAHLLDHDNDGDLDLYYTGGRIKGISLVVDALLDNVGDVKFSDVTWTSGMADPGHGKASALVDLDRDGAWDIVTTTWDGPLAVYHNEAAPPEHHWVAIDLIGRGGNREAIGAIVELDAGGVTQTCFHTNRPSLGGGGDKTCHFGLGTTDAIDGVSVTWPDGTTQQDLAVPVDSRSVLSHPNR